jgi:hypothetical protein
MIPDFAHSLGGGRLDAKMPDEPNSSSVCRIVTFLPRRCVFAKSVGW